MRITIDKDLTTLAMLPLVKRDIADFKGMYTDGDLLALFNAATDDSVSGDIVLCEAEAFPTSVFGDANTNFSVRQLVWSWSQVYEIRFFCDMSGAVNTRDSVTGGKMYSVTTYRREEKEDA